MASSIFQNCQIYLVPYGFLKKRLKLFKEQVTKHGGKIVSDVANTVPTHVVFEEIYHTDLNKVENALKMIGLDHEASKHDVVSSLWLSMCIKEKSLLGTENFKIEYKRKLEFGSTIVEGEPPAKIQRSQVISADHCSSNNISQHDLAINETVIEQFQKLADAYRAHGDRWRTFAYDKAIASLKSYQKPFSNINDLKLLPHVSVKMLDIILEIMEKGYCSKVEEIYSDEKTKVLNLFQKVWGVGDVTAQTWYQKGYRTLEDLRTKANLNWQQEVGLKYFDEIQERLPRSEVQGIVDYVKKTVEDVDRSLEVIVCGSFRRGKVTCKDIDVLVITKNSKHVLHEILSILRYQDFLVADLSVGKNKYLGLCKLPGNDSKIRRLDIFVVSDNIVGCALVHYTGSRHFNIGLRRHAIEMKMKLTEEHLIHNGQVLPTPTEESVFEHLKLDYRNPEKRETFEVAQ